MEEKIIAYGICEKNLFVIEAPNNPENTSDFQIWIADGEPGGTLPYEKVLLYMREHMYDGYSIGGTLKCCIEELRTKKNAMFVYKDKKYFK